MITSVNHLSFTVSRLDASIRFYVDVLGLSLINVSERDGAFSEKVTGVKGAHLKIAYLAVGGVSLELIEYISPKGEKIDTRPCNIGSAHICFNVDDFSALINVLQKNRVVFRGDICRVPAGPNKGKQVVYFEDPDSNTIEALSTAAEANDFGIDSKG